MRSLYHIRILHPLKNVISKFINSTALSISNFLQNPNSHFNIFSPYLLYTTGSMPTFVVTISRIVTVSGIALEMKLRKKWNAHDLESENWLQISKDEIFKIGFKQTECALLCFNYQLASHIFLAI